MSGPIDPNNPQHRVAIGLLVASVFPHPAVIRDVQLEVAKLHLNQPEPRARSPSSRSTP